ncbi:MAG: HAD family hydrolase [Bacillota bacterium]
MAGSDRDRTVLFDLDGTLLPVELDFFLTHYMDALSKHFTPLMSREAFDKALLGATYETIGNKDPNVSNMEAFKNAFTRRTGLDWEVVWPTIDRYYRYDYPNLKRLVSLSSTPRSVVAECVARGWRIILATQPLFPETAVRERMRWCEVEGMPWLLVTTLDNMHFCKPHVEYYSEIVSAAALDPSRCVMVGNDMQEDMIAKNVGMKTVLVDDLLIDRGTDLRPDLRGSLESVPDMLESLLPS